MSIMKFNILKKPQSNLKENNKKKQVCVCSSSFALLFNYYYYLFLLRLLVNRAGIHQFMFRVDIRDAHLLKKNTIIHIPINTL